VHDPGIRLGHAEGHVRRLFENRRPDTVGRKPPRDVRPGNPAADYRYVIVHAFHCNGFSREGKCPGEVPPIVNAGLDGCGQTNDTQ